MYAICIMSAEILWIQNCKIVPVPVPVTTQSIRVDKSTASCFGNYRQKLAYVDVFTYLTGPTQHRA